MSSRYKQGSGNCSGCLVSVLVVFVGFPLLACGGCILLGLIGGKGSRQNDAHQPDGRPWVKPGKQDEQKWAYQFVASKTEQTGFRNVMDLYAFSGAIDMNDLEAFCRERKNRSPAKAFYYVVLFDDAANAVFPKNPFTAEYGLEEVPMKHIRAIYCFNKVNGFSELSVYESNMWESRPTTLKP